MNKKLLLSTTIAGTMLFVGMANPSLAATEVRYNSNWVQANVPSIAIELDVGDKDLSRSELVSIIEKRYSAGSVVNVEKDGSIISDATALVPTGAKVTLSNGKVLTVVTFGDVNGDGSITNIDAQNVLEFYSKGSIALNPEQKKAADVADPEGLNLIDAQRILEYYSKTSNFSTHYVDSPRLPGDETLAVLDYTPKFVTGEQERAWKDNGSTVVGEVEKNGNVINLKVKTAEIDKTYKRGNEYKKWFPIELDLPEGNWTIDGLEFKKNATGDIIVYVDAEQPTTEIKLSKEGEQATITVNILDISVPKYISLSKAEEDTSTNGALIEKVEAKNAPASPDYTEMTVTTNVNRMEYYKLNDVEGYWYKVRAKIEGLSTDLVLAIDPTTGKEYKTEKIDEDEVYVWLNAYNSNSKVTFVSKNATKAQLDKIKSETTTDVTVKIANQGVLKLQGVALGNASATVNQNTKINIDATNCDQNTIVVKGSLRDLTAYNFTDKSKGTATTPDKGGHKYYALVVDFGKLVNTSINVTTGGDNIVRMNDDLNSYMTTVSVYPSGKTLSANQSFLLWLDAENEETEFEVRADADAEGGKTQEHFKFTVKFVDTSAPIIRNYNDTDRNNIIEDVKVLSESTLGDAYTKNAKATKITSWDEVDGSTDKSTAVAVGIRKSAMTAIQRYDANTMWYALRIKTQVKRSQLALVESTGTKIISTDLTSETSGLADDEIVLWVDGNEENSTFYLANKNDITNTRTTIAVTTTDASLLKVTNIKINELEEKVKESDLKEDTSYGEAFVNGVVNNTNKTDGIVDIKREAPSANNGTIIDEQQKVCVVEANKNLLKEFNFRLGTGKWIPVIVDLKTAINVKVEGNLATDRERIALGLTGADTIVLWVNANDPALKTTNNAVTLHSEENSGLIETHTFYFDFRDISTFPAEKEDEVKTPVKGFNFDKNNANWESEYVPKITTHFNGARWTETEAREYLFNQELVNIDVGERKGNAVEVTITGDFNNMKTLKSNAPGNPQGKLVTYTLDLGVKVTPDIYEKAVLNVATVKSVEDAEAYGSALWKSIPQPIINEGVRDYGCSETEIYNNVFVDTTTKDPGVFRTDYWMYGEEDGKGDHLVYVVKYVQKSAGDVELTRLLNKYKLTAEE